MALRELVERIASHEKDKRYARSARWHDKARELLHIVEKQIRDAEPHAWPTIDGSITLDVQEIVANDDTLEPDQLPADLVDEMRALLEARNPGVPFRFSYMPSHGMFILSIDLDRVAPQPPVVPELVAHTLRIPCGHRGNDTQKIQAVLNGANVHNVYLAVEVIGAEEAAALRAKLHAEVGVDTA